MVTIASLPLDGPQILISIDACKSFLLFILMYEFVVVRIVPDCLNELYE
jgi:hypothetical protein